MTTARPKNAKARKAPPPPPRGINWTLAALIGGAVLIVAIVVYAVTQTTAPRPGQGVPIQGADHIQVGQPHPPYNSSPPTSGWHYQNPAPWGSHDEAVPDEVQVHNLEHGGVVVQYNCPQGCPDLVAKLKQVVNQYRTKVILAPYPNMPSRIALTAWGRIDTMDDVDEGRIKRFIDTFIDQGPEKVP